MISHILFNLFSRYNIGSFGFRKILAIVITILIFGLLYLTVRFTGMEIPNYTRNLVMLVTVDLAGFLFLMWKRPKEPPKEEEVKEAEVEKEEVKQLNVAPMPILNVAPMPILNEKNSNKPVQKVEEVEEVNPIHEEDETSKVIIKKIEEVDEVDKSEKS